MRDNSYTIMATFHLATDAMLKYGLSKPVAIGQHADGETFAVSTWGTPEEMLVVLKKAVRDVESAIVARAMQEKAGLPSH